MIMFCSVIMQNDSNMYNIGGVENAIMDIFKTATAQDFVKKETNLNLRI